MPIAVREYIAESGRNHFREWFDGLSAEYAAKVAAARSRMMAGNLSNLKTVDGSLKEFRIDWGPGVRIYLAQEGDALIVLFGGGVKSGQSSDIKKAKELLAEYARRKNGNYSVHFVSDLAPAIGVGVGIGVGIETGRILNASRPFRSRSRSRFRPRQQNYSVLSSYK